MGDFKRGELAKDLEEKTFSLKAGETTDVIRTRQGFIILKVTGHRPAGVPPLKDISDRIREAIYSERLEPASRAYLTKLREQAYIDIKTGYTEPAPAPTRATSRRSSRRPTLMAAIPGKPTQEEEKVSGFLEEIPAASRTPACAVAQAQCLRRPCTTPAVPSASKQHNGCKNLDRHCR